MFSNASLAILDVLSKGGNATTQELVGKTGYSRKQVYRVVDDLLNAKLLSETRIHHNQRVVRVTNDAVIETYRTLTSKLGHIDWVNLLTPATIRVCWYLNQPRRVTTIADRLEITRQAVHKSLSPLKNRAMLVPSGPEYALADDLHPLLEFTHAVIKHDHRIRVRQLAPSATIAWCDPKRALVHVHNPNDTKALHTAEQWDVTGLARYETYGLQFFLAGEPAFWYATDDNLTPVEVVCHTLALDIDTRRVSYAMLLIENEKIEQSRLIETARWYGVDSTISRMCHFINENFDITDEMEIGSSLPCAQEYAALKDQYEVA